MMSFLWRIFSGVGLYLHCPYDTADRPESSVQRQIQPLDPIDVAGTADLQKIRKMCGEMDFPFGINALDILSSPDKFFKPDCQPHDINDHRPTGERFRAHFETLTECGVLRKEEGPGALHYVNGYFSVPKDENFDRSILNAKALSRLFRTPDPVNLQPIGEFFAYLIMLTTVGGGKLFGFVADLRHWFHQISVKDGLSKYFGVHLGRDYYRWVTLPMGWAWSPRVCQCICWGLLLWSKAPKDNRDGLAQTRRELRGSKDPPRVAWLRDNGGKVVGFMTLTYDNICFVCIDKEIATFLRFRIVENFRVAHVTVKAGSERFASPLDMLKKSSATELELQTIGFCHLGVQYAICEENHCVVWRHEPERTGKWNRILNLLCLSSTRREIARACGVVIWHWTILTRPLCFASNLINIVRAISVSDKKLWDQPVALEPDQLVYLKEQMTIAIKNDWVTGYPQPQVVSTYCLFSDASKLRMGAVLTDMNGEVLNIWTRRFPEGFLEAHIYLKELGAIAWYVVAVIHLYSLRNVKLIVVTDNSAAYFSLLHMYSSNLIACRWLRRIAEVAQRFGVTMEYILVGTLDNPADTPSRGLHELEPARLKRGMLAVNYHQKGKRFSTDKSPNEQAGLRHRPPVAGEEEEWDELFSSILDPAPQFAGPDYLDVDHLKLSTKRGRDE